MATTNPATSLGPWDALWIGGHVATLLPGGAPYGAIRDAALAVRAGRVAWVGPRGDLPGGAEGRATVVHEMHGGWLTPGLVDCHTHAVFAGNRAAEFELRRNGAGYEEIARRGGGILSTVAATRAADEAALRATSLGRVRALRDGGVTTLEVKSGYGLDLATERRMLAVARGLGAGLGIDVRTTFLGAHALPPEFAGRADDYVGFLCDEVLPALAREGLVDAVDAYLETIAFDAAQVSRLFDRARALGLPVKLHADQLADGGGAALAARHGALSADHLEHTGEAGVRAMAAAGTVAVLLPGAYYSLGQATPPPVAALRRHGVPMAVATDCNPGTSPLVSLPLAMNLACHLFGLTPEECLAGATREAARALGLHGDRGTLASGRRADLAVWDVESPAELTYWLGASPLRQLVRDGRVVDAAP